ncbi:MAG: hypothetical protein H7Y12_02510 [Sphingobacteriaceae bacterium]|nr:hypothetical protein [Cytophagaceae bacterium]
MTALTLGGLNAQEGKEAAKARKEAAVVKSKRAIAQDKVELDELRDKKADDKLDGDRAAVRADRKAIRKKDAQLMKHRVKRDVAKVKRALK